MNFNKLQWSYLMIAFIGIVLSSAKWTVGIAPWIAYFFLLRFVQETPLFKGFASAYITAFLASLIGGYGVVPAPLPFLVIGMLIGGLVGYIPYLLDKLWASRIKGFHQTLIFPCIAVVIDYLVSFGGQGVWSSIANTQYEFLPLLQIVSVTGLWGVTFLIFWFASAGNYAVNHWKSAPSNGKKAVGIYGSIFFAVLAFGVLRLAVAPKSSETVLVAGVSTENLSIWEATYQDITGDLIKLSPKASQADPDFAKVTSKWIQFIENPDRQRFQRTFEAMEKVNNQLFSSSQKAVDKGAKIVVWSEGIGATLKSDEHLLIERGQNFARQNQIYLCMTIAALKSGKISPESKFLENKLLTINSEGKIINEFHKNIPVGGVEPSVAGDGNIPIFDTEFGGLSPSICYDADFPQHFFQAGKKGTDILVLPSGDWFHIAPYHSYMARMRGIENGFNMVRPVSHGTSIATDAYGRILSQHDFFEDADGILMAEVPTKGIWTVYSVIGDAFAWLCGLLLILMGIYYAFTGLPQTDSIDLEKLETVLHP